MAKCISQSEVIDAIRKLFLKTRLINASMLAKELNTDVKTATIKLFDLTHRGVLECYSNKKNQYITRSFMLKKIN